MEYNYIVINNNLEDASNQVLSILKAERLKEKDWLILMNL